MSLSWALTQQGDIASALVEASRALPALEGASRARMLAQRATILQRLGRFSESLDEYRSALSALRRADDVLWEARLLCNRGVLHVHLGALAAAEADLLRAEALHESICQTLAATQVRHNLGWVAARRGDVPAALAWYDRVEAEYREQGVPLALLLMDRCDVLLSARLATEASASALAAVTELEAAEMGSDLAEARLLAAQAELLAGDSAAGPRARAAGGRHLRPPGPHGLDRPGAGGGGARGVDGGGSGRERCRGTERRGGGRRRDRGERRGGTSNATAGNGAGDGGPRVPARAERQRAIPARE